MSAKERGRGRDGKVTLDEIRRDGNGKEMRRMRDAWAQREGERGQKTEYARPGLWSFFGGARVAAAALSSAAAGHYRWVLHRPGDANGAMNQPIISHSCNII